MQNTQRPLTACGTSIQQHTTWQWEGIKDWYTQHRWISLSKRRQTKRDLDDSNYIRFEKMQTNLSWQKVVRSCGGMGLAGRSRKEVWKGAWGNFGEEGVCSLSWVYHLAMASQVYTYIKNNQIVHFKRVHFITCHLYLNEAVKCAHTHRFLLPVKMITESFGL